MTLLKRAIAFTGVAFLLSSAVVVSGCSSSPDEAEIKQLNDLKEEYSALQKEAVGLEQQKSALTKEIDDKNAKLKKCNDDQQVVRQRLGK